MQAIIKPLGQALGRQQSWTGCFGFPKTAARMSPLWPYRAANRPKLVWGTFMPRFCRPGFAERYPGSYFSYSGPRLRWSRNYTLIYAAPPDREPGSILTPGPIVELKATRFTKVPFAPEGFALMTASAKAFTFSTSAFSAKLALP